MVMSCVIHYINMNSKGHIWYTQFEYDYINIKTYMHIIYFLIRKEIVSTYFLITHL